jgi:imidazolonepropionase-like amidohydrolase
MGINRRFLRFCRLDPMRRICALSLVAAMCASFAVPLQSNAQIPARGSYAFTNVNVVPMDAERLLTDQTVVVESGLISALGAAAQTPVPANAIVIDGRGRYLLPGLGEMHGHLPTAVAEAEDFLFLYLAGGATSVRGMQGHSSQLEIRRRVNDGLLLGPRMWLAAPSLSGNSVADVTAAERLVRDAKTAGYDLLKVHEGLTADVYAAIVTTATEVGLPWGGHVSQFVGVPGALAAGQSTIDHLDDYVEAMQRPGSPALAATGPQRRPLMAVHADPATISGLAEATREAGVAVVPTQMLWETFGGTRDPQVLRARAENRYMSKAIIDDWYARIRTIYSSADREAGAREALLRQRLLKAMNDAGVLILMGTDAPQVFSVPGFSLHRELPLMVESGMTPYEVLRTGTVNVARHLGIEDRAGTVAVGNYADLLLVADNPLEDITAVAKNSGVMVDGRWLAPDFIAERLEAIAAKYAR